VFTRRLDLAAHPDVVKSFEEAATAAQSARSSGPSAEEIAQLPKWEMNALTQGRSEGQVQVFQREGKAIAAQWSASSRTWIEVGEVTGSSANAGTIRGKRYDHVLPIEIDVPGGGVQKLQIGYNNGENPFVTAQQFIDEHMLDQHYLAEIADYIRQRAGDAGPTLGMGAPSSNGHGGYGATTPATVPMEMSYDHLPMRGYKVFDAGVDKKGLTKVVQKILEFNQEISCNQLSPAEIGDSLESLTNTLSITNRYHSSTISTSELLPLRKMILEWDASHAFPALDLARMAVLHPDAAKGERKAYWKELLDGALSLCLGLGDAASREVAVPMLTMRLVCNCYKGGSGAASAADSLLERCVLVNRRLDCFPYTPSHLFTLLHLAEFWIVLKSASPLIIRTSDLL
jgi:phospholipase A-2-activating protein